MRAEEYIEVGQAFDVQRDWHLMRADADDFLRIESVSPDGQVEFTNKQGKPVGKSHELQVIGRIDDSTLVPRRD